MKLQLKKQLKLLKKKIGYEGKITWDENKPTGPKRRVVDINRAKKEFGYQAKTSLEEGIDKTVDWYIGKNLNQTVILFLNFVMLYQRVYILV